MLLLCIIAFLLCLGLCALQELMSSMADDRVFKTERESYSIERAREWFTVLKERERESYCGLLKEIVTVLN